MDFNEILKELSKQFSDTISFTEIFLTIIFCFICVFIMNLFYKRTYKGVSYSNSFVLGMSLMALVTSVAIKTVNFNLTLSLGMLGSLSIIRFRTAIKDINDTVFMFWAILIGIVNGAGLYLIGIISTILIGFIYYFYSLLEYKDKNKYLVVIKCNKANYNDIMNKMNGYKSSILKNSSFNNEYVELIYTVSKKNYINDFTNDAIFENVSVNITSMD